MGEIGEYSGSAMPSSYWNNLINQIALRLTKAIPLHYVTRMDIEGLVYYESPYYICRLHTQPNHYVSMLGMGYSFGYGTYQWKAKAANAVANGVIWLGILEKRHGWAAEGIIGICWDGSAWQSWTSTGGNTEKNAIAGVTWTNENTFKIIWSVSQVKFYVNDVLKTTHNTYIPAEPMGNIFFEVGTCPTTPPGSEPTAYFREQSFEEL